MLGWILAKIHAVSLIIFVLSLFERGRGGGEGSCKLFFIIFFGVYFRLRSYFPGFTFSPSVFLVPFYYGLCFFFIILLLSTVFFLFGCVPMKRSEEDGRERRNWRRFFLIDSSRRAAIFIIFFSFFLFFQSFVSLFFSFSFFYSFLSTSFLFLRLVWRLRQDRTSRRTDYTSIIVATVKYLCPQIEGALQK